MNWISYQPLIGGMSIGAEQAFKTKPHAILSYSGIVNDYHYLDYLKQQGHNIPYIIFDGTMLSFPKKLNEDSLKHIDRLKNIDVVSGVPICSGLSQMNTCNSSSLKARGSDAIQNNNLLHMTEYSLSEIKPKVFIFENAPGLYTNAGKNLKLKLIKLSKKYEYSISFIKTNTRLHGIPQNRLRIFCFFWKSITAPFFDFTVKKSPDLLTFLNSFSNHNVTLLNDFYNKDFNNVYYKYVIKYIGNDFRNYMIENNHKTIAQVIVRNNHYNKAKSLGNENEITRIDRIEKKINMGKSFWDNSHHFIGYDYISSVIGKNMWKLIHPTEDRYYSIREFMRFMGLPDDFELKDGIKNTVHISQNVPVNTSRDMHEQIVKYLNNELQDSKLRVIEYNYIKDINDHKNEFLTLF